MLKSKGRRFQRARQPDQIVQRRESILHAALDLFEKKGLEKVTLADIGHEAGTAKSNLYRYFENREHIYLILLQREGADWEKRVLPPLQKLKGQGTIAKVADIIAESFIQSERYSLLITVINSVLEKNLSPELVINFRSVFYERRMRFAQVLEEALPDSSAKALFPFILQMFAEIAGLWPMCHPSEKSRKLLAQPEHSHLNLNFKTEMSRFLRVILTQALVNPISKLPAAPRKRRE